MQGLLYVKQKEREMSKFIYYRSPVALPGQYMFSACDCSKT